MPVDILDVLLLLAAGLMVGNELTVALFLHPTLSHLQDEVHAPAAISFAALFGRVMPFWYVAVFLLTAIDTWVHWREGARGTNLFLASALLFLIAIVYTLILPAPLNRHIAAWQATSLPSSWRADRARWDRLHAIRMAILLPALVTSIAGVVLSRSP